MLWMMLAACALGFAFGVKLGMAVTEGAALESDNKCTGCGTHHSLDCYWVRMHRGEEVGSLVKWMESRAAKEGGNG